MPPQDGTIVMEGVKIVFRNFAGKEGQYNREGDRNFAVLLDEKIAQDLASDGWNVKWLKPREDADEGDEPQAYLQVSVGYGKGRPPTVVVINQDDQRVNLDEHTVGELDWYDIKNVDLIVRPYHWEVNGKAGIKAYLKSIYATIEEDELERKYPRNPQP